MKKLFVLLLLIFLFNWNATVAADKPNVLLIICDDCGYGDITPGLTPSISELAGQSAQFSDGYANALCSPTRASMYTGRYSERAKVYTALAYNAKGGLPVNESTFAERLSTAGYHNGLVGKWHLGHIDNTGSRPLQQGWADHFGSYSGAIDQFTHHVFGKNNYSGPLDWYRNGVLQPNDNRYSVFAESTEASNFISNNTNRPWSLVLAYHAIHSPRQAPDGQIDYFGMLRAMDTGIGQVLDTLESTGQANNTIVWFISDNGGYPHSRNAGLRGAKGTLWEGGIKVRTYVRWPAHITPSNRVGVVHVMDFMPTILDITGTSSDRPLDGQSLKDSLLNQTPVPARKLFWSQAVKNPNVAERDGRWKYARIGGVDYLFDLQVDPFETTNQARNNPSKLNLMKQQVAAWRNNVGR